MKTELILYAKGLGGDNVILEFIEKKIPENFDVSEAEHIIDFLIHKKFKSLKFANYNLLKEKAEKWIKKLSSNVSKIDEVVGKDFEVVLDFEDGFRFVKLISKEAYTREGALMSHCVASYFGRNVEIYSLRDSSNKPHCTIEKDTQIKGKGNGDIHPKYIDYVVRFLEWTGMVVRDSEMKHLGYIPVIGAKYCKNKLYRNKYIRKNEEAIYDDNVIVCSTIEEVQRIYTNEK